MADPSRIWVPGPLEAFAAGFAKELLRQGYTPDSASRQMHLMAHLSRWLEGEGLDAHALCAAEVERFLGDRRAAAYTRHRTSTAMRPMLGYLRALGVAPPPPVPPSPSPNGPAEVALEGYRHYLTVEQGLRTTTARGYVDAVRPFLRGRVTSDGSELTSRTCALPTLPPLCWAAAPIRTVVRRS